MLTIDWLGRRYTLVIDYLMAGLFFLLIQLCVARVYETLFIFGVRAFTAGIFNVVYIYTTEVQQLIGFGRTETTVYLYWPCSYVQCQMHCAACAMFQVYPTTVRSIGLGSSSATARIGAMITPFIAQVSTVVPGVKMLSTAYVRLNTHHEKNLSCT